MTIRFAAIGITHSHIGHMTDFLTREGATLVAFQADEEHLAADYGRLHPEARRVQDRRQILEDPSIQMVITSAIPAERAGIAIAAMRHGKDVMTDKPGVTTLDQLAEVRRAQEETGRIFSICYSEHFNTRSTIRVGELVKAGAIGEIINTVGLGPHQLKAPSRLPYFFDRKLYGGILCDIASHQVEQFLFFTDSLMAEGVAASVANRGHPEYPGLQDTGDLLLRAKGATGYVRVDWFTPDGLGTWGDGRLTILGTDGYIEARKYIDIAGRPGKDHVFLVDKSGTRYVDCTNGDRPYGRQLIADVLHRTETAMPQARCFNAMEITLKAQQMAERGTPWQQ
jgi:predicted dehydrogenase